MGGHKTSLACLTKMYRQSYGKTQCYDTKERAYHVQPKITTWGIAPTLSTSIQYFEDTPYLHNDVKCHRYAKISIINSIKGHRFKTRERACLLLWGQGITVTVGGSI